MFRLPAVVAAAILSLAIVATAPCLAAGTPPAPQSVVPGEILRGHFVQTRQLKGFAKPLKSEGSFVLAPGRGLIWHNEKPFDSTAVITAGGILQLAGGREAMRLPASKLPGLAQLYHVLSAALSGNSGPLQQSFTVTRSGDENGWKVVLKPRNAKDQAMSQLQGLVLQGSRFVDSIEVERTGGDIDRIVFSAHRIAKADPTAEEAAQMKAAAK